MVCSGYDPRPVFQLDGSRYAGLNCGCAVTAMAIDDATCGAKRTTAATIRQQMGDTSGGTNIAQAVIVADRYYGVNLTPRYRLPWAEYEAIRRSGRGAYLAIGYGPIRDSRFAGSKTFRGNHGVYDPPSGKVIDPLADGRYSGIYNYRGEVYPRDLMRRAAGALDTGFGILGSGLVYAAFTVDNDVILRYRLNIDPGTTFHWWRVENGNAVREERVTSPKGMARDCTAPRAYPWPGHRTTPISLVRITSGTAGAGRYVQPSWPGIHVTEVSE